MKLLILVAILLTGCGERQSQATTGVDWARTKDCADQSARTFLDSGYKRAANVVNSRISADFINHYDSARTMCFMLLETTTYDPSYTMTIKTLADAYEGRIYGDYGSNLVMDKGQVGATHIFNCYVISPDGEKRICKTGDEFDSLVNPYMGVLSGKAPPAPK